MKLKKKNIRRTSEEDPLTRFHAAIRSPKTDYGYTRTLRRFLCDVMEKVLHGTFEERAKEFVEIGRNDTEKMTGILLGLSDIMRERTKKGKKDKDYLNPSAILPYFNPIKKLLNSNDILVNWKRINGTFPELDNVNKTQGWTREEIRLMLDHAKNARNRALILVMASSGMRREGVLIRWGDLTPIYDVGGKLVKGEDLKGRVSGEPACVGVKVYRGTSEEYPTFITPEAYRAVREYAVEWEADVGRKPGNDDPIFKGHKKLPTGMGAITVGDTIRRIAVSAGVWVKHPDNPKIGRTPASNGLRRFFNKTMKETKSRESRQSATIKAERMMGHKGVLPLDFNYYKTDMLELAALYVNAVPDLTIRESERPRQADARSDTAMLGLAKYDGRIRRLDDMSQSECLELLEVMLVYRRIRFAGSANHA